QSSGQVLLSSAGKSQNILRSNYRHPAPFNEFAGALNQFAAGLPPIGELLVLQQTFGIPARSPDKCLCRQMFPPFLHSSEFRRAQVGHRKALPELAHAQVSAGWARTAAVVPFHVLSDGAGSPGFAGLGREIAAAERGPGPAGIVSGFLRDFQVVWLY